MQITEREQLARLRADQRERVVVLLRRPQRDSKPMERLKTATSRHRSPGADMHAPDGSYGWTWPSSQRRARKRRFCVPTGAVADAWATASACVTTTTAQLSLVRAAMYEMCVSGLAYPSTHQSERICATFKQWK